MELVNNVLTTPVRTVTVEEQVATLSDPVDPSRSKEPCCSARCHISCDGGPIHTKPFYLLHFAYLLIGGTFIGFLTSKTFNVAMKCGWLGLFLPLLLTSSSET